MSKSPLHTIGLRMKDSSSFLNSCNSKPTTIKPRNNHHYNISYQNYHFNYVDREQSFNPVHHKSTSPNSKDYDYHLKFLLVGDSDVGKEEILEGLQNENLFDSQLTIDSTSGVNHISTTLFLDGKRIKIELREVSGPCRFSTILRSFSHGILLVYDITNKWSFLSCNRYLHEIEEHVPGIPKILIGNRCHLAFSRQVHTYTAENYALKHNMSFFEISALCNYNIKEALFEMCRVILKRHGMDNLWKNNSVPSLQEICCRSIVSNNTVYSIDNLPIPNSLKHCLKSYLSSSYQPNTRLYSYKCGQSRNANCLNHVSFKKKAKSLFNSMFRLNS